jgi:hypothetical protein
MQPTTIGIDLAKHVFQVHAVATDGKVLVRRKQRLEELVAMARATPGPIGAVLLRMKAPDPTQFRSGRQFGGLDRFNAKGSFDRG